MIAVLDYGIGNLRSAEKALQRVGADARLVDDPDDAADADGVVLPGVGAFGRCAEALARTGLGAAARDAVARGVPFLGICVGFQLLYEGSEEDPAAAGLGVLPGTVRRLPAGVKHPQMQWNTLDIGRSDLLAGVPDPAWVYFVHSYRPGADRRHHVHLRLRRRGGGDGRAGPRVGHAVPPGEVRRRRPRDPGQLRGRRRRAGRLMDLYPAIDIRDGGAVRLTQGDFDRQSDYGDPVALARRFAAAGAPWLHVVDLDAARSGRPVNRATVLAIAAAVDVPVQTGGGVRSLDDVAELLGGGVARVILGTAALDDPGLVRRATAAFPGRVALGLDYRRTPDGRAEVAVRGWEEGSGRTVGRPARRGGRCRTGRGRRHVHRAGRHADGPRRRRAGRRARRHRRAGHRLGRRGLGRGHRRRWPPSGRRRPTGPRGGWPGPSPARRWSTGG